MRPMPNSTERYCTVQVNKIACKRSSGWFDCDNYVYIHNQTQKLYLIATFRSSTANFIRQMVTWRWRWARYQN